MSVFKKLWSLSRKHSNEIKKESDRPRLEETISEPKIKNQYSDSESAPYTAILQKISNEPKKLDQYKNDLLKIIKTLLTENKTHKALAKLRELIRITHNSSFKILFIEIQHRLGKTEEVLDYLYELCEIEAHAQKMHRILADYYLQKEDYRQALIHLEEILARDYRLQKERNQAFELQKKLALHQRTALPTILGKPLSQLSERYQIQKTLGSGGSGNVYLATDLKLKRELAIKILHPHIAKERINRSRLFNEAAIASGLRLRNIIRIYDLEENEHLIAMEYCKGGTLAEEFARGLSVEQILNRLYVIARILRHIHQANIVHRDIKPSNFLIRKTINPKIDMLDTQHQLVLSDFGIAYTHLNQSEKQNETIGSQAYMAPEQFRKHIPNPKSDMYAFGLVAIEAFLGKPALTNEEALLAKRPLDKASVLAAIKARTPPFLSSSLMNFLHSLCADSPSDRMDAFQAEKKIDKLRSALLSPER